MRQKVEIFEYEQCLSREAFEIFKQMNELEQLREVVRLAELAQAAHQSDMPARRPVNSEVIDPFAGFQLRDQPARPLAAS
jgi:hypothetical protein